MRVSRERKRQQQPLGAVLRSYLAVAVIFGLFLLALVLIVAAERFVIG
jgi:hypothetical protein